MSPLTNHPRSEPHFPQHRNKEMNQNDITPITSPITYFQSLRARLGDDIGIRHVPPTTVTPPVVDYDPNTAAGVPSRERTVSSHVESKRCGYHTTGSKSITPHRFWQLQHTTCADDNWKLTPTVPTCCRSHISIPRTLRRPLSAYLHILRPEDYTNIIRTQPLLSDRSLQLLNFTDYGISTHTTRDRNKIAYTGNMSCHQRGIFDHNKNKDESCGSKKSTYTTVESLNLS